MHRSLQQAALLLSCLPASEAERLMKRLPRRLVAAVRRVNVQEPELRSQRWMAAEEFVRQLSEETGVAGSKVRLDGPESGDATIHLSCRLEA